MINHSEKAFLEVIFKLSCMFEMQRDWIPESQMKRPCLEHTLTLK